MIIIRTTFSQLSQFGSASFKQHGIPLGANSIVNIQIINGIATFFDSDGNTKLNTLEVAIEPLQSGENDPTPTNVRLISGHDMCDITHNDKHYLIDWTNEAAIVYGGVLNVITGELTVDKTIKTFNGTENIGKSGSTTMYNYILPNAIAPSNNGINSVGVCSHYTVKTDITSAQFRTLDNVLTYSNNQFSTRAGALFIRDSQHADAESYKAWLAEEFSKGTPLQIVYKLNTPLTYQLTATEVKSLVGDNTISASTGAILKIE